MDLTRRFFLAGAVSTLAIASPKLILPQQMGLVPGTEEDWKLLLLVGGRASGKTTLQSALMVDWMLRYPWSHGLYLAETAWDARFTVLPSLLTQTLNVDLLTDDRPNVGESWIGKIRYRNGSTVLCASYERARGMQAHFVAVDQPSDASIAHAMLAARYWSADGLGPKVVAGITPPIPAWAEGAKIERMIGPGTHQKIRKRWI